MKARLLLILLSSFLDSIAVLLLFLLLLVLCDVSSGTMVAHEPLDAARAVSLFVAEGEACPAVTDGALGIHVGHRIGNGDLVA